MKQLPDDAGQLLEDGDDYLGARTFETMALARFPELRDDSDVGIGIHLCMAALARVTMRAVHACQPWHAAEVFGFLDEILRHPGVHHDIQAAVAQSYVIPSELMSTTVGRGVWAQAPESLRSLLETKHGQ